MRSGPNSPRRRPQKKASSSAIPLVALILGVVVAGIGIGAALAVLQHRGTPSGGVVAIATPEATASPASATAAPLRTAVPLATPAERPTHRATAVPATPVPTPSIGIATASPRATHAATPAPRAGSAATAAPRAAAGSAATATVAVAAPAPLATPKPVATTAETLKPVATPKPVASVAAVATVQAQPGDLTMSAFSRSSADIVRQYLQALINGDEATARDTLVDPKSDLPEAAILDKDARIRNLVAHGTDDTSEVTLSIETPGGNYTARYFLVKSSAGNPQIRAHDLTK